MLSAVPAPPRFDRPLERLLADRPITHVRWGLERIRRLLEDVGEPQDGYRSFHIAGTNGKGSTAATAAAVLVAAGRRVGLYTSPHLQDVRERIRVDGAFASEEVLQACAERVLPAAERVGATYFEALTAVAFLCFAELRVEDAVVETGLGGRLDATNVLRPAACAITGISHDHTDVLGRSLERIATEKAGIFKAGVPAVVGPLGPAAWRAVRRRGEEVGAPIHRLGREAHVADAVLTEEGTRFTYRSGAWPEEAELRTPLLGVHQVTNAGVALLLLETAGALPSAGAVRRGLAGLRWPGRLQIVRGPDGTWILDAAHNPAAVAALSATLETLAPPAPVVILLSVLKEKPWERMARALAIGGRRLVLTVAPSAPAERRWDPAAAAARLGSGAESVPAFDRALERARELAGNGTVVVCGSFTAVGDALRSLAGPTRRSAMPAPGDGWTIGDTVGAR